MLASASNVYLTGLSGSGKSTVAPILAQMLDYNAIDIDRIVESRAGCRIPQLFAERGEAAFRALERQAIVDAARSRNCVIALGGGALLAEQTRSIVAETGTLVHLATTVPTLVSRLRDTEGRPLLHGETESRLQELSHERRDLYAAAAVVIATDDRTPSQVASAIAAALARDAPGTA